ncbi:bifunctional transcriptional activator/DNA repair enzyme AdaA [Halobacillus ihumii]|uniref:bifunctional transcriptional activator/DNA repair enzyme AdaA n=1 Tax=Halobacillus ihumii TaxID=2686092 RepID=UPI0013D156A4|nr:methylated-DNA--[protein]-cysteine S-methyltransferase [Halobacillus ihumii]
METSHVPNEYWKAIVTDNLAYDDVFFYGVQTTGIFCRPSCKSKPPNRENIRIFENAKKAQGEGFRPCKRCKPDGLSLPDHEWVEQIAEWIGQHYFEPIKLERLAEISHGSPSHLQRTFKRVKGMSPLEYIQETRIEQAIHQLELTDKSITDIGIAVGLPNIAYFVTLFKKKRGVPPAKYRKNHQPNDSVVKSEMLYWSIFKYNQWECYLAATSKGLCFVGEPNCSIQKMEDWVYHRFQKAQFIKDDHKLQPVKEELLEYLQGKRERFTFSTDIKGTAFQHRVWEVLKQIPYGETCTYSQIAHMIGKPSAVRAVGTAIGANPVLVFIPCHRVVGKNGSLTGYRGGLEMKKNLLQIEKQVKVNHIEKSFTI